MLKCLSNGQSCETVCYRDIGCVFEFESHYYMIARDPQGDRKGEKVLFPVKWNVYRGFYPIIGEISATVRDLGKKILGLHEADPARYPLKGEWYGLRLYERDGRLRWSLKRRKKRRHAILVTAVPMVLHLLVALAVAGAVMGASLPFVGLRLFDLFPELDKSMMYLTAGAIQLVGSLLLFFLYRRDRDLFDLMFNAMVPMGLIVAVEAAARMWWMWLALPAVALVAWLLVTLSSRLLEEGRSTVKARIRIVLVILSAILLIVAAFGGSSAPLRRDLASDLSEAERLEAEEQFHARCKALATDTWKLLTTQEKLDLLQYICDYESKFTLGCGPVKLYTGTTSGDAVLGEYNGYTGSIVIQTHHLETEDVYDVLKTTLHELRHAYQHDLVDMYDHLEPFVKEAYREMLIFKQVRSFAAELEDYCSSEEDLRAYYKQEVERDAREWSEDRATDIYYEVVYDFDLWG